MIVNAEQLEELLGKVTPGPWKSSLLMTDLHLERKARISVIKAHEYVGYAVWPDMKGKSVPMVAMTPMCNADNPHDATLIALAPTLAAEVLELRRLKAAAEKLADAMSELAEERALSDRLAGAARERDGGAHDEDCKFNRPGVGICNCGHDELTTALADHSARRGG